MTELNLKLLGELAVIRDGVSLLLPPSKKTRALLAYLVMNQRSLRREKLCSLLWEIPDDPRGALRWSLSKLRNLVDTPGHERIVADRTHIAFALQGASVDVLSLHDFLKQDLDALSTEQLENAVHRYQGHFLEGLELSNFHEFHAWCVAERESATRAQVHLLNALIARPAGDSRARPGIRSQAGTADTL